MRLPWSRSCNDVPPPAPPRRETERELAETKRELEKTKAETDYYRGLGRSLRAIRADNHLAEAFLEAAHARGQGGPYRD